jgi:hypothetical protein
MNANEMADLMIQFDSGRIYEHAEEIANMLRQQQYEIEDLKNANRFIQNFAEEQHQRAVALEMRELTDEEIKAVYGEYFDIENCDWLHLECIRAILRKAQK